MFDRVEAMLALYRAGFAADPKLTQLPPLR